MSTNKPSPMAPTMAERVEYLQSRQEHLRLGGGEERLNKQRAKGKMTARERITELVDKDTFQETGMFSKHQSTYFGLDSKELPADGVVTGLGAVFGRPVHVASQDFTVVGGSTGEVHADKIVAMMKACLSTGTPFVCLNDSGGARIQEGIGSLAGYGRIFHANTQLSGVVPQIAVIGGPCAGGAAYSPALADFVIQTKQSSMMLTGPDVIKQVTGETVTAEILGGANTHMTKSGVTHFVAEDDAQALFIVKKLLSFLPQNNSEDPPIVDPDLVVEPDESLRDSVPVDGKKGYDVRDIIGKIIDRGDFLEVHAGFATNIVVGFARITGMTVGIVANQPSVFSGVLDINASDKASQFIRFCDAFNVPLVTLVDVPGFLPGVAQEHGGVIRHGAKMLYAYSEASVPKLTVVLRKAYGGAYIAMCAKGLGADKVFAWPTAEIAVMGAEGAAEIVFRRDIQEADDPDVKRAEAIEEYKDTFNTPYVAASRGLVDDVIDPAETRAHVAQALDAFRSKRVIAHAKKHGLGPV